MPTDIPEIEKKRLEAFFGKEPSVLILKHIDDLEETFGSSATVIRLVMEGKVLTGSERE